MDCNANSSFYFLYVLVVVVGGGGWWWSGRGRRNCILIFGTLIVYMVCRLQQQYHLGVKGQRQYTYNMSYGSQHKLLFHFLIEGVQIQHVSLNNILLKYSTFLQYIHCQWIQDLTVSLKLI